jgi:hypothetical protein
MQKSHLIQVLRTFTKKEIKDFRKWVQSPMHNLREDIVQLLDYLISNEHLTNDEKLDKALIFKVLFPNEKFDDARIRQTMFFFSECLDSFLIYQKFLEDEARQQGLLAAAYRKRGLNKAFKKTTSAFIAKKEASKFYSDELYIADYDIQKEIFDYLNQHERSENTNFDAMQIALDNYYLINKMRLACVALYHGKVFKVSYHLTLIDEIQAFIQLKEIKEPLILAYYTVLQTLQYPENELHFRHLLEQINQFTTQFTWKDANEIYSLAINYGASKLNQGKSEYRRDVFNLYKNGIQNGVFMTNGYISPYNFKNVVTLGIHLQELDWVEKFIAEYAEKLEPEQRKGVVDFNLAMLYYTKKDYRKAQRLLASFEVDDLLITLNAKFLLIKIYVEEQEFDLLDTHLSTMRVYLNRKEILGYHKNLYKNVIHFTKKINRIAPYTKDEKEKLIEEIKVATPLADKEWFIKQVIAL